MTEVLRLELIEYLKQNYRPGQPWNAIGKKFGIPKEQARNIWLRYRKKHNIEYTESTEESTRTPREGLTELKEDLQTGKAEATYSSPTEIRDLNDLKKFIDTEKWDIIKYVQNYWGSGGNPHWQVKAWLEPKRTKEDELIKSILDNYKSTWKPIPDDLLRTNTNWLNPSMLVINLNDLHFDKLDMDNSTIDKRVRDYISVLTDLALKSYHSANIEEICFVIGNDMFNTDNILNTTTNGTPQDVNTTWDTAYEKVFSAMAESISFLKGLCKKLHVVLVQGNHDRTKSFYLAHALEVYFKSDPSIVFDRSSALKKHIVYGQSFIGFNHGNNVNDKIPLAFATEFYNSWGKCKYHDILISDKHHNNEKAFHSRQTQNEFQGVKLRILPSLSGADRWHSDHLYHSRQSGIALLYDKERGKTAEFEYQL